MSAQTLHRFLEFPKEIQIQIWLLALTNAESITGPITNPSHYTFSYRPPVFPVFRSLIYGDNVVVSLYRREYYMLYPLFAIKNTCKLAHDLCLDWWRERVVKSSWWEWELQEYYNGAGMRDYLAFILGELIEQSKRV